MGDKLPDDRRWLTPVESPQQERQVYLAALENDLEQSRLHLMTSLEAALDAVRDSGFAPAAAELEGIEDQADEAAELEEKIGQIRENLDE